MVQLVRTHAFIAVSLDGFIARKNNDFDGLSSFDVEGEDLGYKELMAGMDGLIMGRGTFQKALGSDDWPYSKQVIVMSRTLSERDIPEVLKDRVFLINGTPSDALELALGLGWWEAYLDGGQLVQSFLKQRLVAELTLTHLPVLFGSGRPLFGKSGDEIRLEHIDTRAFAKSGFVQSRYKIP